MGRWFSSELLEIVTELLCKDEGERPSIQELLEKPGKVGVVGGGLCDSIVWKEFLVLGVFNICACV